MKKFFLLIASASLFLAACNNQPAETSTADKKDSTTTNPEENKEERNKKTVLASIDAFKSLNVDMLLKDASPDIVDYGDGSMHPVQGLDSVKAAVSKWMNTLESYQGDNLLTVAEGDYVMVYGEWSGKYKADLMGLKTAGKSFKNVKDVDIFKFSNEGKITMHRAVQAFDTYLKAMGISMPKK